MGHSDESEPESLPMATGTKPAPAISWAGDRFLRISFGNEISPATQQLVHAACERLESASIPGLCDLTPAYTTVLATFSPLKLTPDQAESAVRFALHDLDAASERDAGRSVEIPVCYDLRYGADLDELAAQHNLTPQHLATIHSGETYSVAFLGFMPGFAYLHGLPTRLATPRLQTPRPRVSPGSIGIAGTQTGIYPGTSPGGWRLIGRTPLRMFDPMREHPSLLAMGDAVRFVPITIEQFESMSDAANKEKA